MGTRRRAAVNDDNGSSPIFHHRSRTASTKELDLTRSRRSESHVGPPCELCQCTRARGLEARDHASEYGLLEISQLISRVSDVCGDSQMLLPCQLPPARHPLRRATLPCDFSPGSPLRHSLLAFTRPVKHTPSVPDAAPHSRFAKVVLPHPALELGVGGGQPAVCLAVCQHLVAMHQQDCTIDGADRLQGAQRRPGSNCWHPSTLNTQKAGTSAGPPPHGQRMRTLAPRSAPCTGPRQAHTPHAKVHLRPGRVPGPRPRRGLVRFALLLHLLLQALPFSGGRAGSESGRLQPAGGGLSWRASIRVARPTPFAAPLPHPPPPPPPHARA